MASSHSHLAAATLLLAIVVAPQHQAHGQTAAAAPSPSAAAAPKTITAILSKAGQFTKFLQLLQSTREAEQITNQLKGGKSSSSSNGGGLTVFAPPDSAFTALPRGALNSLTDQQKTSLVQFHVVSAALPAAQLETVSNPLRTQAGDTGPGKYPLNLTADGSSAVNLTTGVVNATLDGTPLYAGDRLVVYQVSKVLLPWALYGPPLPPAPAPSPAESKKKKKKKATDTPDAVADAPGAAETTTTTASPATRAAADASSYVAVAAVAALWCWAV